MYRIMGGDNKEYGPVSENEVRQWILEGRANARTLACAEGGPWKPLGSFPEFANTLPAASASAPPPVSGRDPYEDSGPQMNKMAVTGLILGLIGLCCCPIILSLPGLIFSIIGLVQINQEPEHYSGRGLAIAGIVIASLGLLLTVASFFTEWDDRMQEQLWEQLRQLRQ